MVPRYPRCTRLLPILKSRGSLMQTSVRSTRPLVVLLEIAVLVAHVQRRHHPLGEDPRAETPRRLSGDPAIKDQLHPVRPAEVEVVPNEILEEQPAAQRAIQHLGEAELGMQDGQLVPIPGPAVGAG